MKYLITGGLGFIGSNIATLLSHNNQEVVILDNLDPMYGGNPFNINDAAQNNLRIVNGSVLDEKLLVELIADVDLVIHTAAKIRVDDSIENTTDYFMTNVMGTNNILEVARQLDVPVMHISTCEVYGYQDEDLLETSPLMPRSPYAASKAGADRMAYAYHTTYDMNICIIRPFNVFGPGQKDGKCGAVIPIWTTSLMKGEYPDIYKFEIHFCHSWYPFL